MSETPVNEIPTCSMGDIFRKYVGLHAIHRQMHVSKKTSIAFVSEITPEQIITEMGCADHSIRNNISCVC